MRSMTGFGRGVASREGERATVELRTVNHRYLDIKLRGSLPPAIEEQVVGKVRASVERGAVTVSVHVAGRTRVAAIQIDEDAARATHGVLVQLAAALGVPGPDLALVLAQPGVVVAEDADDRAATTGPLVLEAVDAAIVELQLARGTEGLALERELLIRLSELTRCQHAIAGLADPLAQTLHSKLVERVRSLVGDIRVDAARLAQEAAVLADRADISEELVRLESHLAQARKTISSSSASGRKLEFLGQELGREFNTIGAKSQLSEISTVVIEAKTALEKFREQVQNVE